MSVTKITSCYQVKVFFFPFLFFLFLIQRSDGSDSDNDNGDMMTNDGSDNDYGHVKNQSYFFFLPPPPSSSSQPSLVIYREISTGHFVNRSVCTSVGRTLA